MNVFGALNDHQWRDARKYIISMILNTDMTNHFENVSHLQVFYELAGEEIRDYWATVHKREGGILIQPKPLEEKDKRLMLLEIVLHAADISNPIKPFDVYEQWADRVMEEFFTQVCWVLSSIKIPPTAQVTHHNARAFCSCRFPKGDKEREEGLDVAAMYDRNLADKPSAQVGFIEFIVVPLYLELLRFAPGLDGIIPHMLNNHETYCNQMIAAKESDPDADKEAIAKLKDKPSAFRKRFEGKLGEHRVQTAMDQNPIVKKPSMKVSPPH